MKNPTVRIMLFAMLLTSIVCALFVVLPPFTRSGSVEQMADGPTPWPPPGLPLLPTVRMISNGERGEIEA